MEMPIQRLEVDVLLVVLAGMHYVQPAGRFEGEVALVAVNRDDARDTSSIGEAFRVIIQATADDIIPREVTITRLGDPARVTLAAANPGEPYLVGVLTVLDPEVDTVELPVLRPPLVLTAARPSVQGFGLEKTDIQVRAEDPKVGAGVTVTLQAKPRGDIRPAPVTLDEGGSAVTSLRSEGVGLTKVEAEGKPLGGAVEEVYFAWPWRFAISALLGGLLGAYIKGTRRRTVWSFLASCAVGIMVAVLYAVGINAWGWSPDAHFGEALTFGISFLGAYGGKRLLDALLPATEKEPAP
jgi:hypothetical protein